MKNKKSHISKLAEEKKKEAVNKELINSIVDMVKNKNIDIDEIGDISKVTLRQNITTDKSGELQTKTNFTVQISPSWEKGPEWPLIEPGPLVQLQNTKAKSRQPKEWETAVIVPDIQIGYYRKSPGDVELEPIHDEQALSVALEVIKELDPKQVIMVGDNLDFAEFGKYATAPAFKQMVQSAIDRATMLCAQVRAAAPHASIVWIQGNHEKRLPFYIQNNAEASFGLTRGKVDGELRDGWPIHALQNLLHMERFGVEYISGYPANKYYINSNLMVVHGDKVVSNNSTTKKYLDDSRISVIYGHIHRNEIAYRTRETENGPRTIMAASPGCLCRIDGAVPSTKSGADEFGIPVLMGAENWQQGLGVVQYQPNGVGDEWFNYEPMWIYQGRGMFRGKEYFASKDGK